MDLENECAHCKKIYSTKGNLTKHLKNCKIINNTEKLTVKKLKQELDFLKRKLEEKDDIITKLEKEIELSKLNFEKDMKIVKLEITNEIYKNFSNKFEENIFEIAKQPTNTTTTVNNYKNKISMSFDLKDNDTVEQIQHKLKNNIDLNYVKNGQKGIANLVFNEILKNDSGINDKYICTDYSRGMFKFKDKDGNLLVDNKAKKLTDIVKKGIEQNVKEIIKEFNDNENDISKVAIMAENGLDILNMNEDNSNFRNQIINLSL